MSLERRIEIELQSPSCTVMSPSFYNLIPFDLETTSEQRFALLETLKQEKKETLRKLESKISEQMMKAFLHENNEKDNIYLDINKKPTQENIMLYFLKKIGEIYNISEKELLKKIKEYSFLDKGEYNNIEEYNQTLRKFISEKKWTRTDINLEEFITNSEWENYHYIIENILEKHEKDSIQVFIDNIETLTEFEQQQINNFLYSRGTILRNTKAYIKINNWTQKWETRKSTHWKFVQSTHDYRSWNANIEEIESEI